MSPTAEKPHAGKGDKGPGGRPIFGGPKDGRPVPPGHRPTPPGYGEILIDAPDFVLYARQAGSTPTPTLDSGWETVARDDDVAITQYNGRDPRRESVNLMLDAFHGGAGATVEGDIALLESLLEVEHKEKRPPVFRVRGGIHLRNRKVVLESLDFGETTIRSDPDDRRIRQEVTLGLLEYVKPDQIEIKRRRKKEKNRYTVKGHITLRQIAAKLKPNASTKEQGDYARRIGRLNGIRDVRKKLKPGTKLKLP